VIFTGICQLFTTGLFAQPASSIYEKWHTGFIQSLKNTHDMALPSWGPYSNKYNGLSHVPTENSAFRFEIRWMGSLV
jgi:hypothetical protein